MRLLLAADKLNSPYYKFARQALDGFSVSVPKVTYGLISLYVSHAKKINADAIVLSNDKILSKLVYQQTGKLEDCSSNDWAGSCFVVDGMKIIITTNFKQCLTTPTGKFKVRWYVHKHLKNLIPSCPVFEWCKLTPNNIESEYKIFQEALYIAVDIETKRIPVNEPLYYKMLEEGKPVKGLAARMPFQTASGGNSKNKGLCVPYMDMLSYCGLFKDSNGKLYSKSVVLEIKSMSDIYWMRKFNNLEAPKIMQNGGYDCTYFIRYGAPLYNYVCDTFHFMHSWYAELPRTLKFIASLFVKDYEFWKDEMSSNRLEYNAKDTYYTLWSWVFMVKLAPQWAKDNYLIEFRKIFPCITCGLEGFLVDKVEQMNLMDKYEAKREKALASLQKICWPSFNPNSSVQVKSLMNALSTVKYKNADEKALKKWAESDELSLRIAELILEVRGATKKIGTYLQSDLFEGRLLYEINAGGTDTGRLASKASNLWVGNQIQNQDNELRTMYIADTGWVIANCDGSQAESRTTAYISEDATLITTVETAKDFHTRNASLFFGIPEDEIVSVVYESITQEDGTEVQVPKLDEMGNQIKDKSLRDLSKRVNHGSNYNMAEFTLSQTMGRKNVLKAKELLKLPASYGIMKTCTFLLQSFENTYPDVKGKYYDEVIEEIRITGKLVGPTGWTRYCFETPSRAKADKLALNKYVAHGPQSLSSLIVDEAMFDFWYEYQIKQNIIRLKAPVHDEVVYMVKPENYNITKPALSELLSRPVMVRGRKMVIPNDGGGCDVCWGKIKD